MDAYTSAKALINQGFTIIPSMPDSKMSEAQAKFGLEPSRGITFKSGYNARELWDSIWARNMNIHILTGEESTLNPGWYLADVDIDCEWCAPAIQRALPPTGAIFGHPNNPRGHYLYWVKACGPRTMWTQDRNGLVEIRTKNCSTMAPGSVNPEFGTKYLWYRSTGPGILNSTGDLEEALDYALSLVHGLRKVKTESGLLNPFSI